MKKIFDWLREQIGDIDVNDIVVLQDIALAKIDIAELKWEEDCCEWKVEKEVVGVTLYKSCKGILPYTNDGKIYCPYCGKKIREVE